MKLLNNEEIIELNYTGKTNQVTFSIADFTGNVLMRGDVKQLPENRIPIGTLKKGLYTLCIVDGDTLIKNRFQKDQ
jgi:hypothetical protein